MLANTLNYFKNTLQVWRLKCAKQIDTKFGADINIKCTSNFSQKYIYCASTCSCFCFWDWIQLLFIHSNKRRINRRHFHYEFFFSIIHCKEDIARSTKIFTLFYYRASRDYVYSIHFSSLILQNHFNSITINIVNFVWTNEDFCYVFFQVPCDIVSS